MIELNDRYNGAASLACRARDLGAALFTQDPKGGRGVGGGLFFYFFFFFYFLRGFHNKSMRAGAAAVVWGHGAEEQIRVLKTELF